MPEEEEKPKVEGRCMKCKEQVEIQDGKEEVTANGMLLMKGKCPKCGTTVCRMMGKAPGAPSAKKAA